MASSLVGNGDDEGGRMRINQTYEERDAFIPPKPENALGFDYEAWLWKVPDIDAETV